MSQRVIHLKWNEQRHQYVDCGVADVIGQGTIHSATVDVFRCRECGREFDLSEYEICRVEDEILPGVL